MFPSCLFYRETFWAEVIQNWKLAQLQNILLYFTEKRIHLYNDIKKCFDIFFISHKISGYMSINYL